MDKSKKKIELIQGDCLEKMKDIPSGIFDMILCDLPYGTTACKWDAIIPFEPLWEQYKRIIKDNGAIVLTASQPFTSALVMSNPKMFKYCWVWEKNAPAGFAQAKNKPMTKHEDVVVFSLAKTGHVSQCKNRMVYNPQGIIPFGKEVKNSKSHRGSAFEARKNARSSYVQEFTGYPGSVINIPVERSGLHPTQKPVALMEYLIKTYTNEGDTVLDNCMGSGTTGVACKRLNRTFTGIEKDPEYFKTAERRINMELKDVKG